MNGNGQQQQQRPDFDLRHYFIPFNVQTTTRRGIEAEAVFQTWSSEPLRGEIHTAELLYGPPQSMKDMTGIDQALFEMFLDKLTTKCGLSDTRELSAAQRLIIFLYIVSRGSGFRRARWSFSHSTRTISRFVVLSECYITMLFC
jgi:hypothetical protein